MLFIIAYLCGSCFFGWLTWILCNPYGHISRQSQLIQSVLTGAFWPFILIYMVFVWAYYTFIKK